VRSSTSSSEHGVVRSALTLAALLLGGYALLVQAGLLPDGRGLDQEQANVVRLERYLYDSSRVPENVLVGSSLAYNIRVERLDPTFVNLGLAGGCSQTGLAIIAAAEKRPGRVFIEVGSLLLRKEDEALVEEMTNPWKSGMRRRVPAFQQRYQPINVAIIALKERFFPRVPSGTDPALRNTLVEARLRDAQSALPGDVQSVYLEQLDVITAAATDLASQGIEVVYVHIPIEPTLERSAYYRDLAELTRKRLPRSVHRWLPEIDGRDWVTDDGVHLTESDAEAFARHLSDFARERSASTPHYR
jgi:hypothetical protein